MCNTKLINITYISRKAFIVAMEMAFVSEYSRDKEMTCNGYKIDIDTNSLLLSEYSNKSDVIKFPYIFNKQQTIDFAYGWLESVEPNEPEPDTDGSCKKGFQITTDGTGCGSKDWGIFIAIKPVWIVYGK